MGNDFDDLNRSLRRSMLRIEAESDQELAAFKEEYMGLTEEERTAYREWVKRHVAIQFCPNSVPIRSRALVQVYIPQGEEGDITAALSPSLLLKAIEAWDKGEMFRPDGWRDCG